MGYKDFKLKYKVYLKRNSNFIIIFIIYLLVNCLILVGFYTSYQGSADSARYFFSTLAQSQAAIVAIVITLTLVAVQLASQTYTPRIMDLLLKSKMFWFLLSFYGISIVYDVAVLAIIPPNSFDETLLGQVYVFGVGLTFNTLILTGLIFTMGTFIFLFPYIINVIKQLKPDTIIETIIKNAEINEIIVAAEDGLVDDPLLPVKEISKKALISGDDSTFLKAINELNKVAEKVIAERNFVKRKTHNEILSTSFLSEVNNKEERQNRDFDNNVISYFTLFLYNLTERSLEYKSIVVFNSIAMYLGNIGIYLANKNATVLIDILAKLKDMDKSVMEKGLETETWAPILNFKKVSIEAAKNENWDAVEYSMGVLGLFISKYSDQEVQYYDEDIIYGVIGSFQHPFLIVESIDEIGRSIVKVIPNINGSESIYNEDYFNGLIEIDHAVKHLNKMAEIAIKREWWGWESTMKGTVSAIIGICGSLIHEGGENLYHPINPTTLLSKSLEKIATSSINSEVYYETKSILIIMQEYAEYLANKSSKNVSEVVDSLIEIYKFVHLEHPNCDMMLGAPGSLRSIGMLTMSTDNNWLTDSELKKLKEKGYVSPEKCKPTTQKIADALEEISINSSEMIATSAVRNIIFFGTAYLRNKNEEISIKLIDKIKNINESKNNFDDIVTEIMLQNENGKTFGLHKYSTIENGMVETREIKMDGLDFKAFLKFKGLYNKR